MSQLAAFQQLSKQLESSIIGQGELVKRILISLLADGHLLVEGAPGLAKTRAISKLSELIDGDFQRIQFTPDLLPGDITGTEVFRPQDGSFDFQAGPIFHNLVLADEINRAPAKVQSALLEAMSERQISVASITHKLPDLFLVMATQNPIEQEGTFPLPEAQLDRFLMYVSIDFPNDAAELEILRLSRNEALNNKSNKEPSEKKTTLSQLDIMEARQQVLNVHMSDAVENYIIKLISATRHPQDYGEDFASCIEYGVSPRGTIALDRCARAHAWLNERDFVSPEDVQALAGDVLRHRLGLSYQAEAKGITRTMLVEQLLQLVPSP
jgi:MoxR-like ATPase